jgi:dynein heavy chain
VFQAGTPQLSLWSKAVPAFSYSKSVPYFQMLVPTVDTVRVAALLDVCLQGGRPLLLVGEWPAALHGRVTQVQ